MVPGLNRLFNTRTEIRIKTFTVSTFKNKPMKKPNVNPELETQAHKVSLSLWMVHMKICDRLHEEQTNMQPDACK